MVKVLLIGGSKLSHMPFASFYIDAFLRLDAEIHLVCWNRDGLSDVAASGGIRVHVWSHVLRDEDGRLHKVLPYWGYRRFVLNLLMEGQFDFLVGMHTMPTLAIFDFLLWRGQVPFVFDYRDVTLERFSLFRELVNAVARKAEITFVSSDGFRRLFDPGVNLCRSHNFAPGRASEGLYLERMHVPGPLRVRFWGFLRQGEANRLLVDRLGNDLRFELHFHGREEGATSELRRYVQGKGVKNVYFHGRYLQGEQEVFAGATDILHNLYDNDATMTYAVSNKYYDGLVHYLPQICMRGSHMGHLVERAGVGFAGDPNGRGFADELYEYYQAICWPEFHERCDAQVDRARREYYEGIAEIGKLVRSHG